LSDEPCTDGSRFAPEVAANTHRRGPSFRPARPWCCWAPPRMSAAPTLPPPTATTSRSGCLGGKGDLRVRHRAEPGHQTGRTMVLRSSFARWASSCCVRCPRSVRSADAARAAPRSAGRSTRSPAPAHTLRVVAGRLPSAFDRGMWLGPAVVRERRAVAGRVPAPDRDRSPKPS
jgi:hypothetical protein